jgi:hypothetical protein
MDKDAFKAIIATKGFWKQALAQIKTFGITFIAALGCVWGVAEMYLETYVRETATEVIEEQHGKKSFREILGEQFDVPTDIVPYYLAEKLIVLDSLMAEIDRFEGKYVPHLDYQMKITPMYRFLDDTGIEWWMGPDGRAHGVLYDNGEAWCVYSNRKQVIGNSY